MRLGRSSTTKMERFVLSLLTLPQEPRARPPRAEERARRAVAKAKVPVRKVARTRKVRKARKAQKVAKIEDPGRLELRIFQTSNATVAIRRDISKQIVLTGMCSVTAVTNGVIGDPTVRN